MGSRRTKGDGALYQRPDGLWVATLDLGFDMRGKRRRKSVSARTQAECLRKLRELKRSVDLGVVPTGVTVEQWMRYWLASASVAKLRESTRRGYRTYVERWIIPALGRKRLDRLQPADVERMLHGMEEAGQSAASRRQCRAVLQSALKLALREQRVSRNVAQLAASPAGQVRHHQHLEVADARRLRQMTMLAPASVTNVACWVRPSRSVMGYL